MPFPFARIILSLIGIPTALRVICAGRFIRGPPQVLVPTRTLSQPPPCSGSRLYRLSFASRGSTHKRLTTRPSQSGSSLPTGNIPQAPSWTWDGDYRKACHHENDNDPSRAPGAHYSTTGACGSGGIRVLHAEDENGGWCGFAGAGNTDSVRNFDVGEDGVVDSLTGAVIVMVIIVVKASEFKTRGSRCWGQLKWAVDKSKRSDERQIEKGRLCTRWSANPT